MAENQEMKSENNELAEQEMQEVAAGGGVHCSDGRLIVTPAYHCEHFKGSLAHFGGANCAHCDYESGKGILMLCNHPSHRR